MSYIVKHLKVLKKVKSPNELFCGVKIRVKSKEFGDHDYLIQGKPYVEPLTDSLFIEVLPLYLDYDFTIEISLKDAGVIPNCYNDRETFIIA